MEEIKFKSVCKEATGASSLSEVTVSSDNEVTFENSSTPSPVKVSVGDIDSGSAPSGNVITSDGIGGATWESVGQAQQNVITLASTSGTLTDDQLTQAQESICFVKLTAGGIERLFRKYLETSTAIYFTLVSEGETSGGSAQVNRNHIEVTISTKAYSLVEGELLDTYNKDQIDTAFTEVDVGE